MNRLAMLIAACALLLAPAYLAAQGVLVVEDPSQMVRLPRPPVIIVPPPWPPPPPPPPWPPPVPPRPTPPEPQTVYKVRDINVQVRVVDQVAQVQLAQTFENTGSRQIEAAFIFPLPYDGAIDSMTLMVDGREYAAKLLDAGEARRLYEAIVRKNRDPALLEWMGTGLFKTSVFPVPPGAKRTVSLRYSQLCRKVDGLTDFLLPLSTARYTAAPCESISIRISIESAAEIKNVYSPTHPVEIKRPDANRAVVSWEARTHIPAGDFRLFYDVGRGALGARLLSYRPPKEDEGFFLLLASPQVPAPDRQPPAKTCLFVIDRSGSMTGRKIEQVRSALKEVIGKLNPGDLFNIIAYDSQVEAFRPELQRYDADTRKAALAFVDGLYAGGSTNIDGALRAALAQLQDPARPSYVIFLTDGLPTTGETNEMRIAHNAREANRVRARIFCFGVGYDVNARLLDKLARDNFGQTEFVRPEEDIEAHVARLCGRIAAPVLTDVRIEVSVDAPGADGSVINRVYPEGPFDLFAGEQLLMVGRYRKAGPAKVVISGNVGSTLQKIDFPATLVERSADESAAFIEKLWAVRRVGRLLEELDLKGRNEELIKELVGLATRHGILTPYTSFMADDSVNVRDIAGNVRRAAERLSALDQVDGAGGVAQRAIKGDYTRAHPAAAAPDLQRRMLDRFGAEAASAPGAAMQLGRDAAREAAAVENNVRTIGARTFFRRNGQWIDAQVAPEQQSRARRIKQFSDEYFALAAKHGRTLAQYMAFDEPVMLAVGDEVYLIEP